MEDVRFTDPYPPNDVGNQLSLLGEGDYILILQQQQPLYDVHSNSDSLEKSLSACTIHCSNHQGKISFLINSVLLLTSYFVSDGEEGTLISQVSREFSHQSGDSIEATKKSESLASKLHIVDEVEGGLVTKKNQFRKAMALETEIQQKLTRIKKLKEDLQEKLSAIKANISFIETNNSSIKAYLSFIETNNSSIKAYLSFIKAIISADETERYSN
ncbi:hypothetical protein VNO78_32630 [Psophocarpus tetragonolobus]|uniref:Uncharacterized protein n=1 Tax=Psophocarpus tetragonolobus TaxID=3891 RepID=A0AAN9RS42_PSOTE